MELPHRRTAAMPATGPGLILAGALAALLLAGCASRGAIVGRVRMPAERPKDVVVMAWLEDGSRPAPPARRARVVQARGRFEPGVLVVEAGTTVEFENRDRVFHKVFSVTPKARFALAPHRPGEVRESAFAKPGVVQVYCELHPREMLHVVVVPDRWHARPAADGAFAFSDLRPGNYMLRAWHPVLGDVTQRIEVPAKRPAVLTFRR